MTQIINDNPTKAPQTLTLGKLLESYNEQERVSILDHFEEAIRSGDITAVPLQDTSITVKYTNDKGKSAERRLKDELILVSPRQKRWFDKHARLSRAIVAKATGEFGINEADIAEDPSVFETYARLRREHLNLKKRASKKGNQEGVTRKARTRKTETVVDTSEEIAGNSEVQQPQTPSPATE